MCQIWNIIDRLILIFSPDNITILGLNHQFGEIWSEWGTSQNFFRNDIIFVILYRNSFTQSIIMYFLFHYALLIQSVLLCKLIKKYEKPIRQLTTSHFYQVSELCRLLGCEVKARQRAFLLYDTCVACDGACE